MLTNKQKNIISKNYKKKSVKDLSKILKVSEAEIDEFIESLDIKKIPKWFYLIMLLIPIFLLLILEFSLIIFNYGKSYDEWIELNHDYEILNPDIAGKYFSGINNLPFSTESFLLKPKPQNSFRVITLGASSGAGYPYQNSGSFTKYLRKAFNILEIDKKIEVANISMAAINSYTILDLLDGVLEKNPDLIILYLGHNEYYGAMGIGSKQSIAKSRELTNLIISLKRFRIYQLVESSIASIIGNSESKEAKSNTLMSRIAQEKSIPINSELYKAGINQFAGNIEEIIVKCNTAGVKVLIGTLVSNIKDIAPFISVDENISANDMYKAAQEAFETNQFIVADSLYRSSKDKDGLRFRAPEQFNKIIRNLAAKHSVNIAPIDSIFRANSISGIIGDELMVDHLHPNLKGYQLMGKIYLEKISSMKALNFSIPKNLDSAVLRNYNFTKFDSTISNFKIKILKNDWPFNTSNKRANQSRLLAGNTMEDIISRDVMNGKISRLEARLKLVDHYEKNSKFEHAIDELVSLLEEFPTEQKLFDRKTESYISSKRYKFVNKLLMASFNNHPNAFNTKYLGIFYISNNNHDKALRYLLESFKLVPSDPQVLFNIAGSYFYKKDYKLSYEFIQKCLSVSPEFKNATTLKFQLEKFLFKK